MKPLAENNNDKIEDEIAFNMVILKEINTSIEKARFINDDFLVYLLEMGVKHLRERTGI